jgi:hypothetical protein
VENAEEHGKNIDIVQEVIEQFFLVLRACAIPIDTGGMPEDVTLEISIHSPSDRGHYFKPFDFDAVPITVPELPSSDTAPVSDTSSFDTYHDLSHAGAGPVRRLFGRSALDVRWDEPLLPVNFITGLVVRRQTRRRLTPLGACRILQALPNLQTVSVEFWREWTQFEQDMADPGEHSTSQWRFRSQSMIQLLTVE